MKTMIAHMNPKGLAVTMAYILLFGCTDLQTYNTTYSIVNETEHDVDLRFFQSVLGQQREFVFSVDVQGSGMVLKRSIETNAPDTNGPTDVYEADSVAVIFNNERVEGHVFIEPLSGSIINRGDYESNEAGDNYIFYLTETNYNNATHCDGPCN